MLHYAVMCRAIPMPRLASSIRPFPSYASKVAGERVTTLVTLHGDQTRALCSRLARGTEEIEKVKY